MFLDNEIDAINYIILGFVRINHMGHYDSKHIMIIQTL